MKQGKSPPAFGPYLRSLGLARKPAKAAPADDAERASIQAAQAVRDAFKRGHRKVSG